MTIPDGLQGEYDRANETERLRMKHKEHAYAEWVKNSDVSAQAKATYRSWEMVCDLIEKTPNPIPTYVFLQKNAVAYTEEVQRLLDQWREVRNGWAVLRDKLYTDFMIETQPGE